MWSVSLLRTKVRAIWHQTVLSFRVWSIIGAMLLLIVLIQCFSGIMLAFSLSNDSMLVATSREAEDMDDLYTDDFFWLHERGVDLIFILIFLHYFRKQYAISNFLLSESSWKTGGLLMLVIHAVIFTGLVLCCTHLSDITLTIASNIIKTFTLKVGKIGFFIFTDDTLNTDTLVRLMYLHYTLPFLMLFLSTGHLVDIHYNHRDDNILLSRRITYTWSTEVFKKEMFDFCYTGFVVSFICLCLYTDENEPLSYEIFMWGDIGIMNDPRYLGVAPHWYFRAYMSWLIFCPHHYFGIAGMLYFFMAIYFQPRVLMNDREYLLRLRCYKPVEISLLYNILFLLFLTSCVYVTSFLPYGRIYTEVGGNGATIVAFAYIFIYLGTPLYDIILELRSLFLMWLEYELNIIDIY